MHPKAPHATASFLAAFALTAGLDPARAALPSTITYKDFFAGKATFSEPLFFSEVPGKPGNYVILEQHTGNVIIATVSGETVTKSTMVTVKAGNSNETGLLGFAFHPKFTENRRYYLSYNPTNDSSVVEERVADTSLIKDAGTAPKTIFRFKQPAANHNGGTIGFSPKDGYFYVGFGDGGGGGDTYKNSRVKNTFFAKILRVDVDKAENGKNYGIPADNPFVGQSDFSPEIWIWGVRNPWKWSFDPLTHNMWIGDVGQDIWEEIDIVEPKGGVDLGWVTMEGKHCYNATTCTQTGMQLPIYEYNHSTGQNCIVGGHVFRANPNSPFYGAYFFADDGAKTVYAIKVSGTTVTDTLKLPNLQLSPTSFGTDLKGNLYIVGREGRIFLLDSPDLKPSGTPVERLRREKSIRCCFNQVGKTWVVRNTSDAVLESLHLTDLEGRTVQRASSQDLRRGIAFTSAPGIYLAHASTPEGRYTVRLVVP